MRHEIPSSYMVSASASARPRLKGWRTASLRPVLSAPVRAAASTTVLAPVKDNGVAPGLRDVAYNAVREGLAGANYQVVTSEEAQKKLQASQLCIDLECASSILSAVGAKMLVTVALEPASETYQVEEVY